jgi:hypothetical protein
VAPVDANPAAPPDEVLCPVSGHAGVPVKWITVQAHTVGPIPDRQTFRVCMDRDCDVIYFGELGAVVRRGDLATQPGFKTSEGDGMLCFCFPLRRSELTQAVRSGAGERTIGRIEAEVRAGNCACEIRNPTGRCCLAELRREADGCVD